MIRICLYNKEALEAWLEDARRRKREAEEQQSKQNWQDVFASAVEKMMANEEESLKQQTRSNAFAAFGKTCSVLALIVFVSGALMFFCNNALDLPGMVESFAVNQNLETDSRDFVDLSGQLRRSFVKCSMTGQQVPFKWCSLTAQSTVSYGNEILSSIDPGTLQVMSVQANPVRGQYYVLCSFNQLGRMLFVVTKEQEELRLVSVDLMS